VGAVEQKHGEQKQRRDCEQREDYAGCFVAAVIDLHGRDHGYDADQRPDELPGDERVGGAETLLGHDGGGAEHHHQADEGRGAW